MEKKDQCPFFCQSEIDGGKKCETVCSHCLPKDVKKVAEDFVREFHHHPKEWKLDEDDKKEIECFIAGAKWASQSSEKGVATQGEEKRDEVRFAELCIVFGLSFDGLRQQWKDGTGQIVTRQQVHDFIMPKLQFSSPPEAGDQEKEIAVLKNVRNIQAELLLSVGQNYQKAVEEIERLKQKL